MLKHVFFLLFCGLLSFPLCADPAISDDAGLLTGETRAAIAESARKMRTDFGVHFLLKTEERQEINNFERESKDYFVDWIQNVASAKGVLIYMQIEKNSMKGRIKMSFGYGLKGFIEPERMQVILNEKLLPFCNDLSAQGSLIEGVDAFFTEIAGHYNGDGGDGASIPLSGDDSSYYFWRKVAFVVIPLFSLVLTLLIFVYKKRKCPECGARVHVSIRPTVRSGEGRYNRIKIVKCLECSYYKKYLY
jgi:uncharacterized membrane protein YgcG